jgi:hypothetical protein
MTFGLDFVMRAGEMRFTSATLPMAGRHSASSFGRPNKRYLLQSDGVAKPARPRFIERLSLRPSRDC